MGEFNDYELNIVNKKDSIVKLLFKKTTIFNFFKFHSYGLYWQDLFRSFLKDNIVYFIQFNLVHNKIGVEISEDINDIKNKEKEGHLNIQDIVEIKGSIQLKLLVSSKECLLNLISSYYDDEFVLFYLPNYQDIDLQNIDELKMKTSCEWFFEFEPSGKMVKFYNNIRINSFVNWYINNKIGQISKGSNDAFK